MRLKEIVDEVRLMGPKGISWFIMTKAGFPPVEVDVHEWNTFTGQKLRAEYILGLPDITEEGRSYYGQRIKEADRILQEIEKRRPDIKVQPERLTPTPKNTPVVK